MQEDSTSRTINASESLHWMTYQLSLAVSFISFKCYSSRAKSNSKISHLAPPHSNAANYKDLGVKGGGWVERRGGRREVAPEPSGYAS